MIPTSTLHHALCDSCDKQITGVRYHCLYCDDFDCCSNCFSNASFPHKNKHIFAIIQNPLNEPANAQIPRLRIKTIHKVHPETANRNGAKFIKNNF